LAIDHIFSTSATQHRVRVLKGIVCSTARVRSGQLAGGLVIDSTNVHELSAIAREIGADVLDGALRYPSGT